MDDYVNKHFKQGLIDLVIKYQDYWSWDKLSNNPVLPIELLNILPHHPWNYDILSSNSKINIDIINKNITKNWNWFILSQHPNIKFEDIKDHLDYPWVWQEVSRNKNVTWDIVKSNPNFNWDIHGLYRNPSINSIDIVNDLDEITYDNSYLDFVVSCKYLERYTNIQPFVYISSNNILDYYFPDILTWDIKDIHSYSNLVTFHHLSSYDFDRDIKILQRTYYAIKIQSWWREIISNPYHYVGKKALHRKFELSLQKLNHINIH